MQGIMIFVGGILLMGMLAITTVSFFTNTNSQIGDKDDIKWF